ncbi:MAG: MMPL family transporter [Calditrichia bacterium]
MRDRLLSGIANAVVKKTGLLTLLLVAVTLVAALLSEQLELTMHFRNLMPQDHPMVQEFNKIIEDYETASMIIVAAIGPDSLLRPFAEELAPKLKGLTQYLKRVDYRLEKEFYKNHGLMLQKTSDLKKSREIYGDGRLLPLLTHLNNSFERLYVADESSLSTREKENNAVRFLDNIQYWLESMQRYLIQPEAGSPEKARMAVERLLIGDEYFVSPDRRMLMMFAQPTFSINEIDRVIAAETAVDSLIAEVAAHYPGLEAGTTGTMALTRDETVAASQDMYWTSILALALILGLFVFSFRMWVAPLLAGTALTIGIIWAAGFTALTIGTLNIMTSMFAVILMGLGIDFSIHLISVYSEMRAGGKTLAEALEETLLKTGKGVMTGALTTSAAFFTMTISESAGMSEFGIVSGSGVLFCMLATLLVLPLLLVWRERLLKVISGKEARMKSTPFHILGKTAESCNRNKKTALILVGAVTLLLGYLASQITFDYNYLNMEPEGLRSLQLQDSMLAKYDLSPDFALVTASSVEEARELAEKAKKIKLVGLVSSISDYLPSPSQQEERRPILLEIRKKIKAMPQPSPLKQRDFEPLVNELRRLQANIIELSQLAYLGGQERVDEKCQMMIGDPESGDGGWLEKFIRAVEADPRRALSGFSSFQDHYFPHFRELVYKMSSPAPIRLADLPQSLKDQFISKSGQNYLVTIYPREQVWNLRFLETFTEQMQNLSPRVTGLPPVFYVLIKIIGEDGKNAAMLALVVILLLLIIDFRSLKDAVLAIIPLLVGAVWMVGLMVLLGMQLTIVNVMGIPLILGIGIDDGVHMLHRYRAEKMAGIRKVFTSTGRAVLLTSLTTMLAFGSLKFATYRGLGSLGSALFIGVAACFLATVFILPALLKDKENE